MDYKSWLGSFFLVILISSLLLILTPEGGVKKIAKILSAILVFFSFLPIENHIFSLSADFSYQEYLNDAEYTLKEAEIKYKNDILRLTREKIAECVSSKAAEWGMQTEVTVELHMDQNNKILPESICIIHQGSPEEDTLMKLTQWIFSMFAIKPARQTHIFK